MKKKNFLCGLGAKLALAVVALTTVTFTSCEKEDFSIEVIKNPAKVTLNVDVLYFNENGMPAEVEANVTFNGGTNNVFQGTQAQPELNTEVEVVAEYLGNRASKKVTVKANANVVMSQNVTLYISATELVVSDELGASTTEKVYGQPGHAGHGYTHDGRIWNENANEYFLTVEGEYPVYDCVSFTDADIVKTADAANVNQEALANMINAQKKNNIAKAPYKFTVSAYSIFTAFYTKVTTEKTITITNKTNDKKIATINAKAITSNGVKLEELAHPDHAGHYQHGHGHGHGNGNAGGGIIFAD